MLKLKVTKNMIPKKLRVLIHGVVLCGTLFSVSTGALASHAQILNYLPNCKPDIVKTVTIKRKLPLRFKQHDKDKQLKKALTELVKQANKKNAEAIIITNNKVRIKQNKIGKVETFKKYILELSADLVQLCEDDKSLSKELTKFSDDGLPQNIISTGTKVTQTVRINTTVKELHKPNLTSNVVSSYGNIYGLDLTSTSEQTIKLLGIPSFVFSFNDSHKVLAYGRNHWFHFMNDTLVKASTSKAAAEPFTYELINQLPFDKRFDDLIWSVDDSLKKGDEQQSDSPEVISHSENRSLTLNWSGYTNQAPQLTSFELADSRSANLNHRMTDNTPTAGYDWISEALNQALEAEKLILQSEGEIVVDKRTKRYVYDNRLFFDVKNKKIRRIVIGDPLYKIDNTRSNTWHFGNYYQGQTLDDAKAKTTQTFTEVNEELHINFDNYTLVLNAYDGDIYKLQIDLY